MIVPGASFALPNKPRVVYTDTAVQIGTLTNKTFSGVSFGAAGADRLVVVCVSTFRNLATTNSVTIGGVSATAHSEGGSLDSVGIYSAIVPTGTSGTVQVNSSSSTSAMRIFVYSIYGLKTPSSANFAQFNEATVPSITQTIPKDCVIIAVTCNRSIVGSYTFGGTLSLNKDQEAQADQVEGAVGSSFSLNGGTSLTVTSTYSTTPSVNKMSVVGWV